MQVKRYFSISADVAKFEPLSEPLRSLIFSFYIAPPCNVEKIPYIEFPQLVCFNAIKTIYEHFKGTPMPEIEAPIILHSLIPISSGYTMFNVKELQPNIPEYSFRPHSWRYYTLIVASLWYIFHCEKEDNMVLLTLLANKCQQNDVSKKMFECFKKLYEEQKSKVLKQEEPQNTNYIPQYHIADKRKTDVMKVLYYMYQLKLFTDINGNPAKGIKKFMQDIGTFYGEDFSNYAQHISKAKEMDTYMNIFNDLESMAKKDYLSES